MTRVRPRAEPHRVDVRRPRPGRTSRGTPPPPPKRKGCRKPALLALVGVLAVVLGLPMLLAGMWSHQPELGRPLTLAALLAAFFAASLMISRSASPIRRPRSTVAGRDNSPAGSASLRGGASSRPGSTAAASGTGAADGADSSTIPAVPAHRPDTGETATGRCVTPVLEIR